LNRQGLQLRSEGQVIVKNTILVEDENGKQLKKTQPNQPTSGHL
jgi:hypothetical protein